MASYSDDYVDSSFQFLHRFTIFSALSMCFPRERFERKSANFGRRVPDIQLEQMMRNLHLPQTPARTQNSRRKLKRISKSSTCQCRQRFPSQAKPQISSIRCHCVPMLPFSPAEQAISQLLLCAPVRLHLANSILVPSINIPIYSVIRIVPCRSTPNLGTPSALCR